jgi:uncharacterized protein (TIGR02246 family)
MKMPRTRGSLVGSLALVIAAAMPAVAGDGDAEQAIRDAAASYAAAFNEGDLKGIAAQWAEQAELVEAEVRLSGRQQIMSAIEAGLARNPGMTIGIDVDEVIFLSPSLARVDGNLWVQFGKEGGGQRSRFTSLRILEGDSWLLAESTVIPNYDDAIDAVAWLAGTWRGESPLGLSVRLTSELSLDGHVLVSRLIVGQENEPLFEAMDTVHADRQTGELRCWSFDSTGARAEGFVVSDGNRLNRILTGIPSEGSLAGQSRWVQAITQFDENRIALQSIERSIDGEPLPDTDVLILTRTTP